jgi:hypothetical protein
MKLNFSKTTFKALETIKSEVKKRFEDYITSKETYPNTKPIRIKVTKKKTITAIPYFISCPAFRLYINRKLYGTLIYNIPNRTWEVDYGAK